MFNHCILKIFLGLLCVAVQTSVAREIEPCMCVDFITDCSFRERNFVAPDEICSGTKKINLRGNFLNSMPSGANNIPEIDISKNHLRKLPEKSKVSESIKVLDVSANRISETYGELNSMSSLEMLLVRENLLSTLDFLPHKCVLHKLDASFNTIKKIDGPLENCNFLEKLFLAHNHLVTIPEGVFSRMAQLQTLDLRGNKIVQICAMLFDGLYKLKVLHLNKNRLTSLPVAVFAKLPQLIDLDLSENPLTNLASGVFDGSGQLENLNLGVLQTTALPGDIFVSTNHLLKLTLEVNNLTTLPRDIFKPLVELEKLDIVGRNLYELSVDLMSNLGKLKTLNLMGSKLSIIPEGFFSGLHSLEILDMRNNELVELPELTDCCDKLWYADFSKNNITVMKETAIRSFLRTNTTVHLKENPLKPDSLHWAVHASELLYFVEDNNCACGGLRSVGSTIDFCVKARCNKSADFQDWVSAARRSIPETKKKESN